MALTYEYKITSLKAKTEGDYQDLIVQTYWTLKGTDENGNSGTFSGATPFTKDPTDNSGPFIPVNELTEADVISWISGVVNGNAGYKKHIDEQIQKQIDLVISPITEPDLPWLPKTTPPETPAAPV